MHFSASLSVPGTEWGVFFGVANISNILSGA